MTRRPTVARTAHALGHGAVAALRHARGGRPPETIAPTVRSELGAHGLVNAVNGGLTDRGLAVRLHLLASEAGEDDHWDWMLVAAVLGVAEGEEVEMAEAARLLADVAGGDDWLLTPETRIDEALIEAKLLRREPRVLAAGAANGTAWVLDLTPLGRQRLRDVTPDDLAAETLRRCGGLTAEGRR